jgi:glycosyltransferase involved in cell wall biosynthesis/2-polyprenyl-3-methyl-5-hydroxy-6-metoxy-1,4-benzoquinol methylase
LRVLVIAPHPYYIDRGTPIDLDILLRALSLRGDHVDVVCYPGGANRDYEGVTLHRSWGPRSLPSRPGFSLGKIVLDLLMIPTVFRLAFTRRYDVVHAGEEAVFLAVVVKWLRGLPFVYDLDSSIAPQMVEQIPWLRPLAGALNYLEGFAIRQALATAPVCNALADLAASRGASHIVTLHDISQLEHPDRQPVGLLASRWGIERPALLYVGNLQPYQGVDLLIEAFGVALGEGSELDLVIAGGVPRDIKGYGDKAVSCGVTERTHFIGHWPNSRLSELLAEAQIVVSPRIRGINTPMKIFPYLHAGRPVLATAIPTHTQILDRSVAALAAPDPVAMGAEILRLERDPDLRARLGRAGRAFVEVNHVFDAHVGRVGRLYDFLSSTAAARNQGRGLVEWLKRWPVDLGQAAYRATTRGKRIALDLVPDGRGRTALDIGCREGFQSDWLKERGYQVISIDVEPTYPGAIVADANGKLPFDTGRFDLIWCSEVIEHLESPDDFTAEVDRLLKPGGKLLLTTPNSAFWIYPIARLFGKTPADLQNPTHTYFFSESDIRRLFPEGRLFGYFPYVLLKARIRRAIGLLSPTFVVEHTKPPAPHHSDSTG